MNVMVLIISLNIGILLSVLFFLLNVFLSVFVKFFIGVKIFFILDEFCVYWLFLIKVFVLGGGR